MCCRCWSRSSRVVFCEYGAADGYDKKDWDASFCIWRRWIALHWVVTNGMITTGNKRMHIQYDRDIAWASISRHDVHALGFKFV
jgi:hypothetical protein